MRSSNREQASIHSGAADAIATEAEPLVRLWDRAEDWTVPRIPPSQVKVLGILRFRGSTNLSTLAREIGAAPSSASRLCDRLEASGMVAREISPANRREIRLTLTTQGRRRLESFDRTRREDFREVLELMDPQARDGLLNGLRAFGDAAQTAREASA